MNFKYAHNFVEAIAILSVFNLTLKLQKYFFYVFSGNRIISICKTDQELINFINKNYHGQTDFQLARYNRLIAKYTQDCSYKQKDIRSSRRRYQKKNSRHL